jgi:hypothetical protein
MWGRCVEGVEAGLAAHGRRTREGARAPFAVSCRTTLATTHFQRRTVHIIHPTSSDLRLRVPYPSFPPLSSVFFDSLPSTKMDWSERYATPLNDVFSREHKLHLEWRVELALLKALGEVGLAPKEAYDEVKEVIDCASRVAGETSSTGQPEIPRRSNTLSEHIRRPPLSSLAAGVVTLARTLEIEKDTHHDIMAVVKAISESSEGDKWRSRLGRPCPSSTIIPPHTHTSPHPTPHPVRPLHPQPRSAPSSAASSTSAPPARTSTTLSSPSSSPSAAPPSSARPAPSAASSPASRASTATRRPSAARTGSTPSPSPWASSSPTSCTR